MGCVENQLVGARMERFFELNGWKLTNEASEADLVLVNSCGYIKELEDNSLGELSKLKATLKPDAAIHMVGCLPAINKEAISDNNGLMVIPRNLGVLNEMIGASVPIEEVDASTLPPDEQKVDRFRSAMISIKRGLEVVDRVAPFKLPRGLRQFKTVYDDKAYYVSISVGCLGRCSFCAVRRAKGKLLSRDPEKILQDFDQGLSQGYKDIVLSADESGSYGRDRGTTLAELLKEFLKRSGDYQIMLRNLDPEWLIKDLDNLIPIFQSGRFPYVVAPLQTGSEEVLSLMSRGYTLKEAADAFKRLRTEVPDMILRTHFIVGFPGETEERFREMLDYARKLKVDHFKVHEFSARPHTRAILLPDTVDPETIKRRAKKLRALGLEVFIRSFFS